MKLQLAEGLALPIEAVTEKLAFIGRTGQGKTYAALRLAEEMHRAGAQFVALDPVGKWWALRLAADGKGQGIEVPVLGGLHGDVPLEQTAGRLIADLICDRSLSAVIDVSQFESDAARNRFAADFAARFFFRKKAAPSAIHLFMEEAQEFVPQNPQGDGDQMVLHHFTRAWKLGRNYGIGGSLITQRPQEVSKKVLNLTEGLFVFQLTGSHERKAVEQWIRDKDIKGEDIEAMLPKLEPGRPHLWSPGWLKVSEVVRIKGRWTFDASATPKVGGRPAAERTLAPIDIEKLAKAMAATVEKAKATDPRELQRRIRELEAELRKANTFQDTQRPARAEKVVRKEVPVLKDGQIARLEKAIERLAGVAVAMTDGGQAIAGLARALGQIVRDAPREGDAARADLRDAQRPTAPAPVRRATPAVGVLGTDRLPRRGAIIEWSATSGTPVITKILNALAELEVLGANNPPKELVALLAGYTNLLSKGFANAIGAARTDGLVTADQRDGRVALTDHGRSVASPPVEPRSTGEIQERVFRLLGGASEKILRAVVAEYPKPVEKADLAAACGYQNVLSKGFANALGRLRTLGFVDYERVSTMGDGGKTWVYAQPVLFLEEARA